MSTPPPSVAPRNLTSLVDTVFLLVFSLLALSDVRSQDAAELVRVELPGVEPGDLAHPTPARRVVLEVTAGAEVRLDDAPLATRAELDRALARARGELLPEELVIDIEADRSARQGVMVELLQHLRLAGFVHVRLLAMGAADALDPARPFGGVR